jgi:hypothetical protein
MDVFRNFFDIFKLTDSFFLNPDTNIDDEGDLRELGYKPGLDRIFTMESVFCLSFSGMGLLPSLAATLSFSLGFLFSICELLIVDMLELDRSFGAGSLRLSWRNPWLCR